MSATSDYRTEHLDYTESIFANIYNIQNSSDEDTFEDCIDYSDFYSVPENNAYLNLIRKIEDFALLGNNWNGYGAIPLSKSVALKSQIIIENINIDLLTNKDLRISLSPYSTVIIDWYNNEDEFSLEIGKEHLGYYVDGKEFLQVDGISITNSNQIKSAISQIERDLKKVLS